MGKGSRKKRRDGPEGGGPGLEVPVAARSSPIGTCAVVVGKSRVCGRVMQCLSCRLREERLLLFPRHQQCLRPGCRTEEAREAE